MAKSHQSELGGMEARIDQLEKLNAQLIAIWNDSAPNTTFESLEDGSDDEFFGYDFHNQRQAKRAKISH